MNNGTKHTFKVNFLLIATVIAAMGYLAFYILSVTGITKYSNNTSIKYYESFEDLQKGTKLEMVELPIVYIEQCANTENTNYRVINNSIAEIYNDGIVAKACKIIDTKYDCLGLSDKATNDNKFSISNNQITYLRIRKEYTEYPKCTIVNFSTNEMNYGFMVEDNISIGDICEILKINKKDLSEYTDESTEVYDGAVTKYNIDNFSIELPTFVSNVSVREFVGYSSFFIEDTPVLNFLYGKEALNSDKNIFGQYIKVNDKLRVDYLKENPFKMDSQAYNDFEILINTINSSIKTIKYE